MDINQLNKLRADRVKSDLTPKALDRWNPQLQAAEHGENTISILDVIGEDFWTGEGVTSKRIAGALRNIGASQDITVYINSPGGDVFEGFAIYSLLKEHKGHVTVKVLGLAASAASVIAMAGDTIEISRAGFLMIHNSWTIAVGNRHDFREYAEQLEPFDMTMVDLYEERTGLARGDIIDMVDRETWLGAKDAIEKDFADAILGEDEAKEGQAASASTIRKADLALAKAGVSRAERRKLFNDLKSSTPSATGDATHDASTTNKPNAVAEPLPRIEFNP